MKIELRILSFTLNRRNNWSLHWTQLDQLCGVNILGDEGILHNLVYETILVGIFLPQLLINLVRKIQMR